MLYKFDLTRNIYHKDKEKNNKVGLQYLFNVVILLNIVFKLKLNFKPKKKLKNVYFKKPLRNSEHLKKFSKASGNPE